MSETIKVGMGDYKITKKPNKLITLGLGSCVGICILDLRAGIAGMAHVMLPSIKNARDTQNHAKFADTAIPDMIHEMVNLGASLRNMQVKLAGGAQMFAHNCQNDLMKIGLRNTEASIEILQQLGIPIVSQDVGGSTGRTITFDSEDGSLQIKTVGKGITVI